MNTDCRTEIESTAAQKTASPGGRPVVLVCGSHVISGRIGTNGQRVSDVLNDTEVDYVRLSQVQLLQGIHGPAKAELEHAVVIKESVDLLLIQDEQNEADNHRYRIVQKSAIDVVCCAGGFQLRGNVHLPASAISSPDPVWMLTQQLPQFFAITGVELHHASWQSGPAEAPVVIVNSDSVDMFAIENDDPLEELLTEFSDAPTAGQYRSVLEELGF